MNDPPPRVRPTPSFRADERRITFVLRLVHHGHLTLAQAAEILAVGPQELERRLRHVGAAPVYITEVVFDAWQLVVRLCGAEELAVPLACVPTLAAAPQAARRQWRIGPQGTVVCWPRLGVALDLHMLLQAMLNPAERCERAIVRELCCDPAPRARRMSVRM